MTGRRVDYGDDTAGRYARGRSLDDRTLAAWFTAIEPRLDVRLASSTVVDIGAGTGVFARAWTGWGAERVVGIDPSPAKLSEAGSGSLPNVSYVRAIGERLPLARSSVDVAWLSTVFHQFGDADEASREVRRVLRPTGRVFVRGYLPDHSAVPWLDRFPGADRARARFPTVDVVTATFARADFALLDVVGVEDPTRHRGAE
ncbi:MAG: class I SAM-dependent methyltransferase, partial [Acidimicrobiales bacterium]